jgi:hypothetical protein
VKGVDAWNAWRAANPQIVEPDLSQERPYSSECAALIMGPGPGDLLGTRSYQELAGINLHRAKLQWGTLYFADLQEANLVSSWVGAVWLQIRGL